MSFKGLSFAGVTTLMLSMPAMAATKVLVPVEDLSATNPVATTQATSAATEDKQQKAANAELLMQLETLQQESAMMRGQIEELNYKIKQMQDNQKDRYVDLDRRISNLNNLLQAVQAAQNARPAPVTVQPQQAAEQPASTASTTVTPVKPAPQPVANPAQQQADYKAAFNLIREKEYQQAIQALNTFVDNYPHGALTGNAHYWLGEVYMVERETAKAVEQFNLVLQGFPEHRKVPDAMYKAGRALIKLGQEVQGKRMLEQVIAQYPDSSAARLARELQ